jgi:hypothetical protein
VILLNLLPQIQELQLVAELVRIVIRKSVTLEKFVQIEEESQLVSQILVTQEHVIRKSVTLEKFVQTEEGNQLVYLTNVLEVAEAVMVVEVHLPLEVIMFLLQELPHLRLLPFRIQSEPRLSLS